MSFSMAFSGTDILTEEFYISGTRPQLRCGKRRVALSCDCQPGLSRHVVRSNLTGNGCVPSGSPANHRTCRPPEVSYHDMV